MAPKPRSAVTEATKADKDADAVMGTNNSSIASKRSVEMIYYPQPHFYRYFVKKPQRRPPMINRSYWLRMYTMTETVRQFIAKAPTDKPKFVLNLGCGFEEQKSTRSGHTVFVDIDYEKLMVQKKAAIRQTKEITQVLGDIDFGSDEDVIQINSPRYRAVGCDLKNLKKLNEVLQNNILPSADCSVLLLAEVSLTYMDVQSANEVIKWASKLTNAVQFCILEQFSPDGPEHPFTKTMMAHYNKLNAPLHSIHEFHSLAEQEQRFKNAGWASARARSLWDLWSDSSFLPESVRTELDSYEVFDEWEEFALFESHYFLLIASNIPESCQNTNGHPNTADDFCRTSNDFVLNAHCPPNKRGRRRYGAVVPGGKDKDIVGHHGGQGEQARLASTDVYSPGEVDESENASPSRDIPTRMCHTITPLDDITGDCLLVGGRASPGAPFDDCWLRQDNDWQQIYSLPEPRFRHSATNILIDHGAGSVLVYGGKTKDNAILDSWLLWNNKYEQGWQKVETVGGTPEARFGASFAKIDGTSGILSGGIGSNGTILEDIWTWSLSQCSNGSLQVKLVDLTQCVREASPHLFKYLPRFGATVNNTSMGLVIAGGIIPRQLLPARMGILLLNSKQIVDPSNMTSLCSPTLISKIGLGTASAEPRPLLTGHVACSIGADQILFLGGGAVCFPLGTVWTEGTWLLQPQNSAKENSWAIVNPKKDTSGNTVSQASGNKPRHLVNKKAKQPMQIPRVQIKTTAQFQQIVANGKPVVIEDSDIGPCTEIWTQDYLTSSVGNDRKVVVHEAQSEQMNFQEKNFAYVSKGFGTFLNEVHAGGRQYLRSISAEQPSKLPANLATDFPTLQHDFRLPKCLSLVSDNVHSSPLRISGPVTMWLHYDVMANVLCQIRGERRLILFPPDDVQHLHIPPGASSSTVDIFQTVGLDTPASIPGTSPQEAILRPRDILFIPPLWLHTACSATSEVSIAVNVFFRNLTKGYAAGRDVYGNRDLHAYEKSRQDLQRFTRAFDGVPPDMTRFYLRRLAQELLDIADQ
ncbi:LCM-domain-containing protein [Penicillium longicatenatum]|uniref:LCM-domain-containing protein n=1 Tax=Penicillium longicatenatum TaxID=1561947 RepID=UPI0025477B38|nr:LCM-domain-containing protein [Penicillium longicatenatum]KAJ5636210.1 LCM-domain-containing protein [Penicillium longicatenatum]